MTCATARPLLGALLDGELAAGQELSLREHLESCGECSTELAGLERLREQLRTPELRYAAPDSLRRKVVGALPARRAEYWKWIAIAACVALAISVSANLVLSRGYPTQGEKIAREVLSSHARSTIDSHLMDVLSSDRHTVKPWFSGKLDFAPDVKDFAEQGFPLAGGRVDYVADRAVAVLVFHRAQHVINLFTWPVADGVAAEAAQRGYRTICWTKDGMAYCAASDLGTAELHQFTALYQK